MAKDKKGFMAYADWIHTTEKMTDAEAGQMFKHLLRYVNDLHPEAPDRLIELAFEPWKQQLKRDLKKYEVRVETAKQNGAKGGRPKKQEEPNESKKTQSVILEPKKADTDNETVTVKEKVKVSLSLEERSSAFYQKLLPQVKEFTKKTVREFFDYWTEHNEGGKKMRFELAKNQPFNITRRLQTWKKKETQYGPSKNTSRGTAQTTAERQDY